MPSKQEIVELLDNAIARLQYGRSEIAYQGISNDPVQRDALAVHIKTVAKQLLVVEAYIKSHNT